MHRDHLYTETTCVQRPPVHKDHLYIKTTGAQRPPTFHFALWIHSVHTYVCSVGVTEFTCVCSLHTHIHTYIRMYVRMYIHTDLTNVLHTYAVHIILGVLTSMQRAVKDYCVRIAEDDGEIDQDLPGKS